VEEQERFCNQFSKCRRDGNRTDFPRFSRLWDADNPVDEECLREPANSNHPGDDLAEEVLVDRVHFANLANQPYAPSIHSRRRLGIEGEEDPFELVGVFEEDFWWRAWVTWG